MNRLAIAIAASLALAGCAQTPPVSVGTVAVTQSATAANRIYTSASAAGLALVNAGLLDRETFKAADTRAYSVLLEVRAGRATFAQLAAATALLTGAIK